MNFIRDVRQSPDDVALPALRRIDVQGQIQRKPVLVGLLILLVVRVILQMALYQAGFQSLTADEFGRVVWSAKWALHPEATWSGAWLPLLTYIQGGLLRLHWDLIWIPRLFTILMGIISIVAIYHYTTALFDRAAIGLAAAVMLAFNAFHLKMASTPLVEMPYFALLTLCLVTWLLYVRTRSYRYLLASALFLAIANGIRYEGWMFSLVLTLLFLVEPLKSLWQTRKLAGARWVQIAAALAILWAFPVAWLIGNYVAEGDALFFASEIYSYKQTWYGGFVGYQQYWLPLLAVDPLIVFLGIPSIVLLLHRYRARAEVRHYVVLAVVPFLIWLFMHNGQAELSGNLGRYMATFLFLFYPALAYLLYWLAHRLLHTRRAILAGLVVILFATSVRQVKTAFDIYPSTRGLSVGQRLAALRARDAADAAVAMVEVNYWEYLAIQVGASDVTTILYDRPLDVQTRTTESIITDTNLLQSCIAQYDVRYIVAKTPALTETLAIHPWLTNAAVVEAYTIFRVRDVADETRSEPHSPCPLAPPGAN